jgi:VDE lipocalin domain
LFFTTEFWENWYIIGENDASPNAEEFKFIYYNGKTRQNTYNGAFVYSRTKELSPESLKKVYQIAKEAGMEPKQFCRIQNGCFDDHGNKASPLFVDETMPSLPNSNSPFAPNIPFRGILASTKISELLGVEPVAARDTIQTGADYYPTSPLLNPQDALPSRQEASSQPERAWWYEVGDYLENPHRHFAAMDKLRITMDWPEDVDN